MGLSDMWSEIKPKPRSSGTTSGRRERDELVDGNYTVQVVGFQYWDYDDGTRDTERYKWCLEVIDGTMKGSYVEKYSKASTVGLQILAEDLLLILGKMPEEEEVFDRGTNKVGSIVNDVVGVNINMRQKTGKTGYPNFYFNGVVTDEFADPSGDPGDKTDEDEIPF